MSVPVHQFRCHISILCCILFKYVFCCITSVDRGFCAKPSSSKFPTIRTLSGSQTENFLWKLQTRQGPQIIDNENLFSLGYRFIWLHVKLHYRLKMQFLKFCSKSRLQQTSCLWIVRNWQVPGRGRRSSSEWQLSTLQPLGKYYC